jgi:predicted acetyltransferase
MHVGGNIGYDVSPSYRRNGFGTKILQITVEEAKKIGMENVLITCDDDNIGSYKVIENNMGKLIDIEYDEVVGKKIRRYYLSINSNK